MAGTEAIFDAELAGDLPRLANLLGVAVIDEWPPIGGEHDAGAVAFFRKIALADPSAEWGPFYVCLGDALVGSAGFLGPPVGGSTEIGYSICRSHRRQGLATRAVDALAQRARSARVRQITARTTPDNHASIGVLERTGFSLVSEHPPHLMFALDLAPTSPP